MKKIHIVVQDGLVQEVWVDQPIEAEVVIYDLDTNDPVEYTEVKYAVGNLKQSKTRKIY